MASDKVLQIIHHRKSAFKFPTKAISIRVTIHLVGHSELFEFYAVVSDILGVEGRKVFVYVSDEHIQVNNAYWEDGLLGYY